MNDNDAEITGADETRLSITTRELAPGGYVKPTPQPASARATARENRVIEISAALEPAYAKAGTLEITEDEIAKLTAPFDDKDVEKRPHDGLFYIPHILISDRLTRIFGPGKWTMLRRWENIENNTIFAEWVMIVRGVYIGESVGAHQYHPTNPKQNYSDALESTRGEALRRIAGKYLSCGSQVWSPAYCRGLNAPKASTTNQKVAEQPPTPPKPVASIPSATAVPVEAKELLPKIATAETLKWFLQRIEETTLQKEFCEYACERGIMLTSETLEDWPLDKVPTSKRAFAALLHDVEEFCMAKQGLAPINQDAGHHAAEWYNFPMPYGKNAGVILGELEKNYLFGLWANMTVETEYNGKPKKTETIAKDTKLRQMLDEAGKHYEFTKKD
jgi:hypothetical protein